MDKITPEALHLAMMYLQSGQNTIKKIKVKSEFASYLEDICHLDFLETNKDGVIAAFTGIPIFVDDEIEDKYYEIEYVKEKSQ